MHVNATNIVALVVALGGWALAATTAWLNYKTKTDENFYRALDWLSGGTQKRNLGVAAIEGSWHLRRVRRLSTPLLCSSAVYLLLRSKQDDSANELNNLYRIMEMIASVAKVQDRHEFHYRMLSDALDQKLDPGFFGGLSVSDEKVASWQAKVAVLVENPNRNPSLDS
jgi:hypothetical protein